MKNKAIIITFVLTVVTGVLGFEGKAQGADYYVTSNGSDSNDGSINSPWKTIAKVNSMFFNPGDSILFKRGETFSGRLAVSSSGANGAPIIYGSYGTGDRPIIDGSDSIGSNWMPAPEIGEGVYKNTIGYNPHNMIVNGKQIPKINDSWMQTNNTYGMTGLEALNFAPTATWTTPSLGIEVNFWDWCEALYGYLDGITYIRFRDRDDPNTMNLGSSPEGAAITINGKGYVHIDGFFIRGAEHGIKIDGSNASYNVIENNIITNGRRKLAITGGAHHNDIRYNEMKANFLTDYVPGAWSYGTDYIYGVRECFYRQYKFFVGISSSDDHALYLTNGGSNNKIYNNYMHEGLVGLSATRPIHNPMENLNVYNNTFHNFSSVAYTASYGHRNAQFRDNLVYDCNCNLRLHRLDTEGDDRSFYAYRNRFYQPEGISHHIFCHHNSAVWPSGLEHPHMYIYHNSFSGGKEIIYTANREGLTNTLFLNNIFSAERHISASAEFYQDESKIDVFDYNWVGGDYYRGTGAWYGNNNVNAADESMWNPVSLPDFLLEQNSSAIDAGIDLSQQFTIDGTAYNPLHGMNPGYFSGSAPGLGTYEYVYTTLPCDLTADGSVNIQDIQACVNHILGIQDWGDMADVNNDDAVNVLDVQEIVNIILGG